MTERTMLAALNDTLHLEMERDERVVLYGEDVGRTGGVFRATDGLAERFANRVVDTPIAEAAVLGTAVGLAANGLVPVPEIQFSGFMFQAWHQLAGQISRTRYRTQGTVGTQITIRTPFGGGLRTPELHADSLIGQFANIPGLKVVAPASAADMKGLLTSAIRDPDPVLVLEPLRGYRLIKDDVPDGEYLVPLGKARTVREGSDIVIITWSFQVEVARQAAAMLEAEGVSCRILDLRSIAPLDIAAIVDAVEACGRAVVVEEAPKTGGFGGEIVATINEECLWSLEAPVLRVAGYDTPYPYSVLEDFYVPDAERIAAGVRRVLDQRA